MSLGQRSAACTATASVPADERNSGTADNEAASTAHAPAVRPARPAGAQQPGRPPPRRRAKVPSAACARTSHEATRAFILSDKVRVRRVTKNTSSCQTTKPRLGLIDGWVLGWVVGYTPERIGTSSWFTVVSAADIVWCRHLARSRVVLFLSAPVLTA